MHEDVGSSHRKEGREGRREKRRKGGKREGGGKGEVRHFLYLASILEM